LLGYSTKRLPQIEFAENAVVKGTNDVTPPAVPVRGSIVVAATVVKNASDMMKLEDD
jgi:hypothetical protein